MVTTTVLARWACTGAPAQALAPTATSTSRRADRWRGRWSMFHLLKLGAHAADRRGRGHAGGTRAARTAALGTMRPSGAAAWTADWVGPRTLAGVAGGDRDGAVAWATGVLQH